MAPLTLISRCLLLLSIVLLFSGYKTKTTSPDPLFEIAQPNGVTLKIYIQKKEGGQTSYFTSGSDSPTLRMCQWSINDLPLTLKSDGNLKDFFPLNNFLDFAHPIKIRIEHPDYVLMNSGDYQVADSTECDKDKDAIYIIPRYYFSSGWNAIWCDAKDITLTMAPRRMAVRDERKTDSNINNYLNGQPTNTGNDRNRFGPAPMDKLVFAPLKDSTLQRSIRQWSREYSRLDADSLSENYLAALQLFKAGELDQLSEKMKTYDWEQMTLLATSFKEQRSLERMATLAARVEAIRRQHKLAKKYYDIADLNAPYQVPIKMEFVSYLMHYEDFEAAEAILRPGLVRTPFLKDIADLSASLSLVYALESKNELANSTLETELKIRERLKEQYELKDVANKRMIEVNYAQIEDLQQIKGTSDPIEKRSLKYRHYSRQSRYATYDFNIEMNPRGNINNRFFRTNGREQPVDNPLVAVPENNARFLELLAEYDSEVEKGSVKLKDRLKLEKFREKVNELGSSFTLSDKNLNAIQNIIDGAERQ
ncbi:MAG: hypothetical protein AAF990_22170 [Bacteroidota bacterium]